jgi:hypothetical protein
MSVRFPFSQQDSHYIPESGNAIELLIKDDGHPSWEDCPSHHVPRYSPPRLFSSRHISIMKCAVALSFHEKANFGSQKRKIWENTGGWSPFFSLQVSVLGATRRISGFHDLKALLTLALAAKNGSALMP